MSVMQLADTPPTKAMGFQAAIASAPPRMVVRVTDVKVNYKTALAPSSADVLYIRKTSMRSREQWVALKIGDEVELTMKVTAGRGIVTDAVSIRVGSTIS